MGKTCIRRATVLALAAAVCSIGAVYSQGAGTPQRSVPSSPERQSLMRSHYFEVGEIHDAIIRGDLAAVQLPAHHLPAAPPAPNLSGQLAPFAAAMKISATHVAEAKTLDSAAKATTE